MHINFQDIDLDNFYLSRRELEGIGSVVLITPTPIKHAWTERELHLRSLLCDAEGQIISSGFPKFKNLGEDPQKDLLVRQMILDGRAWFTQKMDGSLIIRSVINGQVHFRTRGSHTLGEGFAEPILAMVRERYPNLLDPTKDARYSILFEYTSPENKIVVEYAETQLTVLGLMDLSASPPEFVSSPELIAQLEKEYGTPGVKFHRLPDSLEEVVEEVKGWKGIEGIVVWCQLENGQLHLVKIKAAEYIRIHSLKFQLTDEKVKQLCWYKEIETLDQLKAEFFRLGVDWEAVAFIQPIFESYISKRQAMESLIRGFLDQIDSLGIDDYPSRKDKALKVQELAGENRFLFSMGMNYLFGEFNLEEAIASATLDVSVKQIRNYWGQAKALAELVESKA